MTTVLVVDDEISVLEMVSGILEDEGYQVVVAENGAAALKLLERTRPDLIISDVMMPEMDGRALCQAVAANPTLADIPFVFLSASHRSTVEADCQFRVFVAKPFDVERLLAMVAELTAA